MTAAGDLASDGGRLARVPAPHVLVGSLWLGFGASLVVRHSATTVAIGASLAALAALALHDRRTLALAAALAAAGWWWGSARLDRLDESDLARHAGRRALVRVEVTGPARRSEFALRVPIRVLRFDGAHVDERSRLELPPERAPPQGAILELMASVALPRPGEGGSFDEAAYLRRQGIHALLEGESVRILGRRGGLGGLADRIRAFVSASLAPGLSGERRAVVAGIVLGEDEGLDADLRDRFRASGLYHLLAVSGQNVAYVVAGALLLAWGVGLPRWAGHVVALLAVAGYVLAVGWQPSVVRAGIAGSLASLAWLAGRPRDRWYFLLVGGAVLLAWSPYSLLEPGFQLSFAAVAAIFVAVPRLERRLAGYPLPRVLAGTVAVSVGCGLATAPILWLHFGAIPVYSVLSNAAAAPAVPPLLGAGLAAAGLAPVLPEAAGALTWVNGWLAAYVATCARLVGALPGAQATSWSALAAIAAVGGFVALWLRIPARPARKAAVLATVAAALAAGWAMWPRAEPPPPPRGLRITFLDVGQGDATLLEVPGGAVLVDQGPPEARVADQLRALGLHRLDALVLTHPSRDNIGGARDVVRRLRIGVVLEPKLPFPNPYGAPVLAEARRRGIPIVVPRAGQTYRVGGLRLRVLWPDRSPSPAADPNDHATVLLVSYGEVDALLPADAESNVTLPLRPPPVEVFKVAHHGSADPGLPELLELVRPSVAVISVGATNDYGHPAPSTLGALRAAPSLDVYRTDEDGRVVLESDGRRIEIEEER